MPNLRFAAWEAIPIREVLNTPGISRAHDYQRMLSYGVGLALGAIIDLPAWRSAVLITICAVQLVAAITRQLRGGASRLYLIALLDLLLACTAIAVGTASFVITLAVTIFIGLAVVASFKAPTFVAVPSLLLAGLPPLILSVFIDADAPDDDAVYFAIIILIAIALSLATFILAVFAMHTRRLQRELSYQERQLDSVLDVTPVLLAAVDHNLELTLLAGGSDDNPGLSEGPIAPDSPLARLIASSGGRDRVSADIVVSGRTFSVTCDPGEDGEALITAYDVTDRVQAQRRLEEVVRSKDQFIAAVSHELRTPLASVVGFSELIQEEPSGEELDEMITEVVDQSAEMAAIIDDLLIAARASFESIPTAPREMNLAAEAAAVIDTTRSRLPCQPQADLQNVIAYADPIRVRQIVRNLLTNADRYGGDRVQVLTRIDGDRAVLVVRDSGEPLPQERRDRIFEPYESSGPVRGQPAAMGLGLSVSRTLAELMGGALHYRHDGEWSMFELHLPRSNAFVSTV